MDSAVWTTETATFTRAIGGMANNRAKAKSKIGKEDLRQGTGSKVSS